MNHQSAANSAASSAYTGLPEGMEYDENRNIFWEYEDADRHIYFRLEKDRICYKFLPLSIQKKRLFHIAGSSYGKVWVEFPDDELSRSFQGMKWIKERRKKNCIKINSADAYATIYVSPSQYDFVLNYLRIRCPDAKMK